MPLLGQLRGGLTLACACAKISDYVAVGNELLPVMAPIFFLLVWSCTKLAAENTGEVGTWEI